MLNIVLVDDEKHVLEGLGRLLGEWQDSCRVIGAFTGAQQLLDSIGQLQPDVIISDINMPNMSGIELAAYVNEHYPSIDVVILSGYGEFDYARKAIEYNVASFLLKPLDEDELQRTLAKIEKKQDENSDHKQRERARQIADLAFGQAMLSQTRPVTEELLGEIGLGNHCDNQCMVIMANIPTTQPIEQVRSSIVDITNGLLHCRAKVYKLSRSNFCICLLLGQGGTAVDTASMETYLSHLTAAWGEDVKIACTEPATVGELSDSFNNCLNTYMLARLKTGHKLEQYSNANINTQARFPLSLDEKLIVALKSGNEEAVTAACNELVKYYSDHDIAYLLMVRYLNITFSHIESVVCSYGIGEKAYAPLRQCMDNLMELDGYYQLKAVFTEQLTGLCRLINGAINSQMDHKVNEIIAYIEENFHVDLSLNELAEHVSMSAGYLSGYFKSKTGLNVTEHLVNVRIEKAKAMLLQTNLKVNEIAQQVGFNDSKYFTTIFRKRVGITPGDYRKMFIQ